MSSFSVGACYARTNTYERVPYVPAAAVQYVLAHPADAQTAAQLRAYVDGKSPISGRPVMQEVIEGLTRPAEGNGFKETTFERATPRISRSKIIAENYHTPNKTSLKARILRGTWRAS